jgi:hypothetical protein
MIFEITFLQKTFSDDPSIRGVNSILCSFRLRCRSLKKDHKRKRREKREDK